MARKKAEPKKPAAHKIDAYIEGAGLVAEEKITQTLEKNYMPYAMSVIVSRAFPEIDGFKPSHRKLLYTMYKMGLLNGKLTKCANIVGATMRLNPHGDGAIYETLVRLSRGNEALLHPYILSKGNFGKAYSRDMAYAASRYTEAKLEPICEELFKDIDKETVDFVPNYDNTMQEPTLFPASFPTILVNANVGIGVSMASAVCPFNLSEVCETAIAIMKNPDHNVLDTLKGPDFPGGGYLLYDEEELDKIYRTGRGSVKLRAKYRYDASERCLEILEIPATTTVEAIIEKIIALIKAGKIREISYLRDETDINGLKIGIDLKKGTDPDKLMQKLYKLTPLQDSYSCNFNILVHGYPKVMGVYQILDEWIKFRMDCVRRRVSFDLKKKKEKLHLLKGLGKILLDIDKAIRIIRETEEEAEVVPNLMIGFGIDEIQAEYVAEIKLRHLNREYILKRTAETDKLESEIADLEETLGSDRKIKNIIIAELKDVIKKYGQERKTQFFYRTDIEDIDVEEEIEDYPCRFFLSQSGYFKKCTMQSLRMASDQKLKEGDVMSQEIESSNKAELLFFSDKANVYKTKASQFKNTKASDLGDYIPAVLCFDSGEGVKALIETADYSGYLIFIYDNGKAAKVPLNAYETKTNRKKLTNAYSDKAALTAVIFVKENAEIMLRTSNGRAMIFDTALLMPKATRNTVGVQVMTLKAKSAFVEKAYLVDTNETADLKKFRSKTIPVAGCLAKDLEDPDQMTF
ncbi:DNA topoisomerase (ATP-hydrolyzing) subunit A [uncultured Ruminococcus sp.]|uniref:DNA gyrase/topoisomerase IV subunit A n=1 Tax=uncultured Ruminococcus sp. TaxID=165186 RepID=UPI0025FC3C0F|nr:DNA topoisomerase (ATP-hydrolyzing) subunit A [uncultured Ruminococcus sp.]